MEFENPAFNDDVFLPDDAGARSYQNGAPSSDLRACGRDRTPEGTSYRYYWKDGKSTVNSGSKHHKSRRKGGNKKAKSQAPQSKDSAADVGGEWSFGQGNQNEGRYSGSFDVEMGRGANTRIPNSFHGNVLMRSTSHHSPRNYNLQFSSNRSTSMLY